MLWFSAPCVLLTFKSTLAQSQSRVQTMHLAYVESHLPCLTFFSVNSDFHPPSSTWLDHLSVSLIQCHSNNREGLLATRTLALLESHQCHRLPVTERPATSPLGATQSEVLRALRESHRCTWGCYPALSLWGPKAIWLCWSEGQWPHCLLCSDITSKCRNGCLVGDEFACVTQGGLRQGAPH